MSPLFVPGPVDVDPEIASAQAAPMMPHRSKAYEEIFHRAESNARKLFFTDHRVLFSASSGSGFHEAAVRSLVPDNGRILSCTTGAFGNRWFDVAISNGKQAVRLESKWGHPITSEQVADALKTAHFDILTIVHNETSTGQVNPVAEIAAAARETSPDTLVCVDAVSSLSGAKIETDAWGLDLVLTSSQKALALPPGLALAAVSDRALEKAETVPNRGWYFDLVMMEKYRVKNSTAATSAVGLIYALDKQLDRILNQEGLEDRFARHSAMASRAQEWALSNGFGLFAAEGYRSQTVTAVENTRQIDFPALNAYLQTRGMRLAGGYGPIKEQTFRIGHMGELQVSDLDNLFEEIERFLG